MAKPTPLPFYDEFMTIFKNHNISNWEAKDFVKLIIGSNVKINKKNQFEIYRALKILVRYKYLSINPTQSTQKRFIYCETELIKELRISPIRNKLGQIFELKELELLKQIQEKEYNISFIKSLCEDNPEVTDFLNKKIEKLNDEISLIKSNISLMEDIWT
ncbi:hypothetical protein [Acinetobacter sp. ETR1]|uniref:hypothetical protein n=1 Tax=unclassified Acinetobacter TaxID=196816 RepID=UPI0004D89A6A|nr:hypothetical protein [Acinetobacter sp. ETR1]KEC83674.1 hypothetical protein DT74_13955 [Acinetobacter sp. ETR1]